MYNLGKISRKSRKGSKRLSRRVKNRSNKKRRSFIPVQSSNWLALLNLNGKISLPSSSYTLTTDLLKVDCL